MSQVLPSLAELQKYPKVQQPSYSDTALAAEVVEQLRNLPPLVFAGESDELKAKIAQVASGEAFILQAGDCAETFESVTAANIQGKLRVLLSMAVVMTYAAAVPVVKIGRIAGQYAKPRSAETETRNGVTLPSYRGDAVNSLGFTPEERTHDPRRLLAVYNSSAATLNLVRAFVTGGFADLRRVHSWNTAFIRDSNVEDQFEMLSQEIERALDFMVACGVDNEAFRSVDFYASHEALIMEYEHALTRIDSRTNTPYDTSAHMLWIGDRTRQLDGVHVEFLRHVRNPLGLKIGPSAKISDILQLLEKLNPENEPGRMTLITRYGAEKIRDLLPPIISGVTAAGHKVAWICDPMHGNTFATQTGLKTRAFSQVVEEVNGFFDVHEELQTWPGGIHVELTGDDVTECVGGVGELNEKDLGHRYETACDPRLNRDQSIELAFLVAQRLAEVVKNKPRTELPEITI